MQDTGAIPALKKVLRDEKQETIVRHEAGNLYPVSCILSGKSRLLFQAHRCNSVR